MTLTLNQPSLTIYANTINQFLYVLQEPSGNQEIGHYFVAGSAYVANAFLTCGILFESRTSVPVSVSVDASDQAFTGMGSPSIGHITMGGCQCYAQASAASGNVFGGGKYTAQY